MNQKIGLTAIDPGLNGGIAWIDQDGITQTAAMPPSVGEVISFLVGLKAAYGSRWEVFIEEVPFGFARGAFPAAMAKLHRQAGILEGALMALGARTIKVHPKTWQRDLHIGVKAEDPKRWKAKLRDEAARRFPGVSATLKTADALLILDHARLAVRPKGEVE